MKQDIKSELIKDLKHQINQIEKIRREVVKGNKTIYDNIKIEVETIQSDLLTIIEKLEKLEVADWGYDFEWPELIFPDLSFWNIGAEPDGKLKKRGRKK